MTHKIAPKISFPGANGAKDADSFQMACRYGLGSVFAVKAHYDPTGNGEHDGLFIRLHEDSPPHRLVEVFIPAWDDQPVTVSETKLTRTPINHNENESSATN